MPSRVLRDGINTSERVDALTDPAELFYRRLMSAVDDWGRYFAKPELLIAELYPLRIGKARCPTYDQIVSYLGECQANRLALVYEVDGKRYVQLLDFRQQHRSPSKFPTPPESAENACTCTESVSTREHSYTDAHGCSPSRSRSRSRISKSESSPRARAHARAPVDNSPGREPALALLRDSGVTIKQSDPKLGQWIAAGATVETLTAAVAKAREYKPAPAAIPVPYLDRVVRDLLNPKAKRNGHAKHASEPQWWRSHAGIERKGRELGMQARGAESYDDFKARIFDRINSGKAA